MQKQQNKNRALLIMIFALSVVPIIIALLLYVNPGLWLRSGVNNGRLIVPPIFTKLEDFTGFDEFSADNLKELKGRWLIANIIPKPECDEVCLDAILKTRQLRLMLSKDLSRTRRVVLITGGMKTNAGQQLWLKDSLLWRLRQTGSPKDDELFQQLLKTDKKIEEDLIKQLLAHENTQAPLDSDLIRLLPAQTIIDQLNGAAMNGLADGMLFLIDPLGNVMMWYEPGFDPYKVKKDLLHLLKISQIG